MFVVHMITAEQPFLEPELFKDRNLVVGLIFIFIVGVILLATLALLPPFLQNLMGFPVVTTGEVLAPRGMGSMVSMIVVGRLVNRVDVRLLVGAGLILTAVSLFQMAQFNLNVSPWALVETGLIQGAGLGLVFVPLSTITFSTLAAHHRTEATSMFSLMRNIGSSIGISVMVALAARSSQTNHAVLGEQLNVYREPVRALLDNSSGLNSDQALAFLNGELSRQAAAIGYLNDFQIMAWMALLAIPFLLLFRQQPRPLSAPKPSCLPQSRTGSGASATQK
jgi:DHA2 family multidrug resistance protein